ncbi:MAG: choice-of-anchor B family protein [Saprospiraceae bacterium]
MIRLYTCLLFACVAGIATAQNVNTTFRSKLGYPGQTLANVWGYTAPDGREYALAGGSQGLIIVDITNPDAPQQIVQIPGPNSLWKEIKTYSHYCYVVSEGGQGIQVVDLANLPSPTVSSKFYSGDGAIAGQLNRIHALHIDVVKGYLYAYGGNLFGGGAKVFDLHTDPWNPKYVGKFDQLGYIHDGYVDNDIMYSGHIYAGQFAVVDMTDKSNPLLISTQNTPGNFTHNTWLTDDRKVILSTDEVNNSVLAAYDVSDPTDIRFLDQIQSNPGSNSVVHNTHILGNFAVTSWYKDGFTIVDISRPDNLVQVGNFDTYPGIGGSGFDGCWGVYPFFPSGTVVATNISAPGVSNNGELYIVTPNYVQACHLEGQITDAASGNAINNATVELLGANPLNTSASNALGLFKMGQVTSGYFIARISKTGYQTLEQAVLLENGVVTPLQVQLFPNGNLTVTGTVLSAGKKQPYENADLFLYGRADTYHAITNAAGQFSLNGVKPGLYDVASTAPSGAQNILPKQVLVSDTSILIYLYPKALKPAQGSSLPAIRVGSNPVKGALVVQYDLPQPGQVHLLDALGRQIQTNSLEQGQGELVIGQTLPSGVYFLQLTANGNILESIRVVITPQ